MNTFLGFFLLVDVVYGWFLVIYVAWYGFGNDIDIESSKILDMIRHLLTLTFRNFARHKTSFLVNLTSLSVGLACILLIYLWVADELGVDKFFQDDSRLYQVMNNMTFSQDIQTFDVTPVPLAAALAEEMPEIEYAVSVNDFFSWGSREGILTKGEVHFKATGAHASQDYFQIFSYPLLAGSKESVLAE